MSLVAVLLAVVFMLLAAAFGLHCLVLHCDAKPRTAEKQKRKSLSRS